MNESTHQLISDYIAAQYGWAREEYTVASYFPPDRKLPESIAMFMVLHNDDLTPKAPGGGKSVILEIDIQDMKILNEWGFQ